MLPSSESYLKTKYVKAPGVWSILNKWEQNLNLNNHGGSNRLLKVKQLPRQGRGWVPVNLAECARGFHPCSFRCKRLRGMKLDRESKGHLGSSQDANTHGSVTHWCGPKGGLYSPLPETSLFGHCLHLLKIFGMTLRHWITNHSHVAIIGVACQIQKFYRINFALIFNELTVASPGSIRTDPNENRCFSAELQRKEYSVERGEPFWEGVYE